MDARATTCRLLAGAISLALLGGCAAASAPSPTEAPGSSLAPTSATSTPMPSPTEAPGWSPAPAPATYGPVTVVEGISVFVSGNVGSITTDPDGTQHARGGSFVFRDEMNDPRVSGEHSAADFSMDRWGDAAGNDALVQWGDSKIVNDDGTWVGRSSGVYSAERGDLIVVWYEGTGAYEGLSYFFMSDSLDITAGFTSVWRVRGQIFPGDPPPL